MTHQNVRSYYQSDLWSAAMIWKSTPRRFDSCWLIRIIEHWERGISAQHQMNLTSWSRAGNRLISQVWEHPAQSSVPHKYVRFLSSQTAPQIYISSNKWGAHSLLTKMPNLSTLQVIMYVTVRASPRTGLKAAGAFTIGNFFNMLVSSLSQNTNDSVITYRRGQR